jgi:putative membrane protein
MRPRPPGGIIGGMYWDHMNGSDWAMMLVSMTLLVLLVVGVAWAILAANRPAASTHDASPSRTDGSPPKTARELLDERLATGEIDLDEYEQRRRALERPLAHG